VHLVAFATAHFGGSLDLLFDAARPYFASLRGWTRAELERTEFYRQHRDVLDLPRGGGYWLWKPFIVRQRMKEVPQDDVVMYLDAGGFLLGDPSALFEICRRVEILVFAGPYEGARGRRYVCGNWTKRDCFVRMGCDEPSYHDAPMAEAGAMLVKNTPRAEGFVEEWLRFASQPEIITDAPNVCGLDNLPGFAEHRHDQSVLSLLAARHRLELFRSASRQGNSGKAPEWRVEGEWLSFPYGTHGVFENSCYGTLIEFHRLTAILMPRRGGAASAAAEVIRRVRRLSGTSSEDVALLSDATYVEALLALCPAWHEPRILIIGPTHEVEALQFMRHWPTAKVVAVSARTSGVGEGPAMPSIVPPDGSIDAAFWEGLEGAFNLVVCNLRVASGQSPPGLVELLRHAKLEADSIACWSDLDVRSGFARAARAVRSSLNLPVAIRQGTARDADGGGTRVIGIIQIGNPGRSEPS